MDAFYSCGKRQRMPAFQSWLTHNPPVIKTANTALSTAAKSVCRHPFMAGIRHKYFLQIFILYYIARDVRRAHFSQSSVSVREPTAAASAAARVSVFREPPSGFTLLQRHGRNSLKVIFLFCGSATEMTGWLICWETLRSLPSSLQPPVPEKGRAEWRWLAWMWDTPADKSVSVTHCLRFPMSRSVAESARVRLPSTSPLKHRFNFAKKENKIR